jgi:hypothetical protein
VADYFTFISDRKGWRLHQGIGAAQELLVLRSRAPQVFHLSAAREPVLWVSCSNDGSPPRTVKRVELPGLEEEEVPWERGRIGAIASSPDGDRAAVLSLDEGIREPPWLWAWDGGTWGRIETTQPPDVSSKLAMIDGARVVYESNSRRLTALDISAGTLDVGPVASFPTVALDADSLYSITADGVVCFPLNTSFEGAPSLVEGIRFHRPSSLYATHDGEVFTWTEPRFIHRLKGYIQQRGQPRQRLREIDQGIGAVLGPHRR